VVAVVIVILIWCNLQYTVLARALQLRSAGT